MPGKQVTELDALPSFTDTSLLPVHNGAGLKKGLLSQLASYLGNKFSNPNLLINPDFKINQRGSTTYTTGYTVDRWRVTSATLNATTKTLSNSNSAGGTFLQSLENKPTGTFTVTLNVASVTGTVKFSWKDGSTYKTGAVISKGLNTYTFTASSLTWVGIDVASGASIQLDYMKLEEGSVATHFVEPNKAEELLKCQRYYEKLEVLLGRLVINTSQNFSTSYKSKFYRVLNGSYRAEKRTTPTISIKDPLTNTSNGALGISASDFKSDAKSFRQFTVSAETNFVDVFITNAEIDAEIY